jgi:DNA gyrase subunit B
MYIGPIDNGSGLHNMVFEVADNAVNEALAGYCDRIDILLNSGGSVTVRDNGRGMPVHLDKESGVSVAELIMTKLHAGGRFGQEQYNALGLHGVGVCVVNALSEWLDLRVWIGEVEHLICFRDGKLALPLKVVGEARGRHGTEITFLPSSNVFMNPEFDFDALRRRLDGIAALNTGAMIVLSDDRGAQRRQVMISI